MWGGKICMRMGLAAGWHLDLKERRGKVKDSP